MTFTLKWRCWAFHHSNEAGLRVIQCGPLVVEIETGGADA